MKNKILYLYTLGSKKRLNLLFKKIRWVYHKEHYFKEENRTFKLPDKSYNVDPEREIIGYKPSSYIKVNYD